MASHDAVTRMIALIVSSTLAVRIKQANSINFEALRASGISHTNGKSADSTLTKVNLNRKPQYEPRA